MRSKHAIPGDSPSPTATPQRFRGPVGLAVRPSLLSWEVLLAGGLVVAVGWLAAQDPERGMSAAGGTATMSGHDMVVASLMFQPDGRTLVSCGWDRMVRFWDVASGGSGDGEEIGRLPEPSHLFSVSMSTDGRYLAAGGIASLSLWARKADSWEPVMRNQGINYRCAALSPDGQTLAVGTTSGKIVLWDVATVRERAAIPGYSDDLRAVAFSPDGRMLAGLAFSGEFRLWDPNSGREIHTLPLELGPVEAFAFTPDSQGLATAGRAPSPSEARMWKLRTGEVLARFSSKEESINSLAFSPDGKSLAASFKESTVNIWDLESQKLTARMVDGVGWVNSMAFSPDGCRLAFGGKAGVIKLWEIPRPAGRSSNGA